MEITTCRTHRIRSVPLLPIRKTICTMMNSPIYCPTIAATQGPLSGALIVTTLPPGMDDANNH